MPLQLRNLRALLQKSSRDSNNSRNLKRRTSHNIKPIGGKPWG